MPIPEKLCKIDEVQRQLAWLQGVMETTQVVCGECPMHASAMSRDTYIYRYLC